MSLIWRFRGLSRRSKGRTNSTHLSGVPPAAVPRSPPFFFFRPCLLVSPVASLGSGTYLTSTARIFFHGRPGSDCSFTYLTSHGGPSTRPSGSSLSCPRDTGREGVTVGVLYDDTVTLFVPEFSDSTVRVVGGGGGVRDVLAVCNCACNPGNVGNAPSAARASSITFCRSASSFVICPASSPSNLRTSASLSRSSNSVEAQCGHAQ